MRQIFYSPAIVISASRVPSQLMKYKEVGFSECDKGKFVVVAKGENEAAVYGLLWRGSDIVSSLFMVKDHNDLQHEDIPRVLKDLGRVEEKEELILGGGFLLAEHEKKVLRVAGASATFGYAPGFMMQEGLKFEGYTIDVEFSLSAGPSFKKTDDVRDWFVKNEIRVDE